MPVQTRLYIATNIALQQNSNAKLTVKLTESDHGGPEGLCSWITGATTRQRHVGFMMVYDGFMLIQGMGRSEFLRPPLPETKGKKTW